MQSRLAAWLAIGWAVLALGAARAGAESIQIDADLPGGNVVLERIEGGDVYLHQDLRDTEGWWFYWYFRVRGAAGRRLTFHFTDKDVLGIQGPAVSTDGGRSWAWIGKECVQGASFAYAFAADADEVRFCFAIPYVESNLREFLGRHENSPHLKIEPLATTRKGRTNERIRLGRLDGRPGHRVLLTCRHHACEMMASWALEGFLDAVLADTDDGRWYRGHVELLVVPMMDKDGVEEGDQGKNRKPHDHNRDYLETSIYPSVAALRQFVPEWSQGKLRAVLDLHCPWIRGGGDERGSNERIVFVGIPPQEAWKQLQAFAEIFDRLQQGPLVHAARNDLPWGEKWNTLQEPRLCARWAGGLPGVRLALGVELPYANVAEQPVTVESARAFGQDLARALRQYLEGLGVRDQGSGNRE